MIVQKRCIKTKYFSNKKLKDINLIYVIFIRLYITHLTHMQPRTLKKTDMTTCNRGHKYKLCKLSRTSYMMQNIFCHRNIDYWNRLPEDKS